MELRVYLMLPERGINNRIKSVEVRIKKKERRKETERKKNRGTQRESETEMETGRGNLVSAMCA